MFPRSLNLLAHFLFRCMTCLKTQIPQSRSTHFHSQQLCNKLCVRGCGDCSDLRVIKCLIQTKLKSICPLCLSHIFPCNKLASMPFHHCIKREVSHVHSLKWPLWVTVYITSCFLKSVTVFTMKAQDDTPRWHNKHEITVLSTVLRIKSKLLSIVSLQAENKPAPLM